MPVYVRMCVCVCVCLCVSVCVCISCVCVLVSDQTRSLLRQDEHLFVETQAFNKAVHSLTQNGLVLLTGPPGCGKSTTARGLLRHFERQDHFTPLILTTYQEWRQHVADRHKVIILLDDLFGDFFFARKKFDKWSNVFSVMLDFAKARKCLIVFTMYQHIATEAQSCPVPGNLFTSIRHVDFHNITLSPSERMQMITTHLQHISTRREEIIAKVLTVDLSGSVFPWCMKNILECCANGQTDSVSVVLQPALSFRNLLSRSLKNEQHGECLAVALLLEVVKVPGHRQALKIMLEGDTMSVRPCKERHVWSLSKQLRQLIKLAPHQQNIGQTMRMAAGVALANSEFCDLLLKVCDLSFLINVGADVAGFCGCVKLDRMSSLYQLFHRRVYSELIQGHLPEICAHPMMHSEEYLKELEQFCLSQKLPLNDLFTVSDPDHKENLLYWSAFCPSPDLTAWCAGHMLSHARDKTNISVCLQRVLLASVMCGDKPSSDKVRCIVNLIQQFPTDSVSVTEGVLLPFPKQTDVTEDIEARCTHLRKHGSYFLYVLLEDECVPVDGAEVLLNNVQACVGLQLSSFHMKMVIRTLLVNRTMGVDEQDTDGNTLLHLAAQYGNADAVKLALRKGSSLTVRNNKGLRPPDLARSRLQLELIKSGSKLVDKHGLCSACREGNLTRVKTLLCLSSTVSCVDQSGNTPLHCACEGGQVSIASLLLELGAEVSARNKDGSTPLHLARQQGFQETANLLLEHGADPVAEDARGITPLYTTVYPSHQSMILPLSSHGNKPSRNDNPDCPFSVISLFKKASLASQNKMRHAAPLNEPVVSEDNRLPNMSGTTPEGIKRSMRSGNGTDTSKDNRRPLRSSSDTATFQYEKRATRRSWGGTASSEDWKRRIRSAASTPAYQNRRRSRRSALPMVTQTGCMLEVDMHGIGALIRSAATGCGHQKTSKQKNVWNDVQLWVGRHPVIVLTVYALFVALMFHWFVHGY